MKKTFLAISILLFSANTIAMAQTCKCSSGSMVVEIEGDMVYMSCTEGGRLHCVID